MKFYIELTNRIDNHYRLQNDKKSWRRIVRKEPLLDIDFLTSDIYEILKIQEIDSKININNELWELNPTTYYLGQRNMLTYNVIVKRYNTPRIPSIEQLKSVIKCGDDRYNNSLILNIYGQFELRYSQTLNNSIEDPSIVFKHETFSAYNDYVGNEASNDEMLMERVYSTALEHWITHLETGMTNQYSDVHSMKEPKEIIAELERIKIENVEEEGE